MEQALLQIIGLAASVIALTLGLARMMIKSNESIMLRLIERIDERLSRVEVALNELVTELKRNVHTRQRKSSTVKD
jgi:hypothetical protein